MTEEEYYVKHIKAGKDYHKKIVSHRTARILELIEKDDKFFGSTEPYGISFISLLCGLIRPKKILEIGTLIGYSTITLADVIDDDLLKIISVELDEKKLSKANSHIKLAGFDDKVELLLGDSIDEKIIEKINCEKPFDFVYLDGSHNYTHLKKELDVYWPMITKNGFLICHDSSEHAQKFDEKNEGGVRKALLEWSKEKKQCIFFDPPLWSSVGLFLAIKNS